MPRQSRLAMLLVALPLVAGACHKKKPVVAQAVQTQPEPVAPRNDPPRPAPPSTTVDPNEAARKVAAARADLLNTIYFDYDAAELRTDAQASLTSKIPVLTANPSLKIRINGHCDERGSDVYNIALGRRRAEMAKRFLTDRGIDASRIETFSYGREKPAEQGNTEDAWAKNRRDMFEITAGGDQLRAP